MEVVNLLHIMFQIWLTDIFLNGHFIGLGPRIVNGNFDEIADPLETIFPKVSNIVITIVFRFVYLILYTEN